MLQPRFLKSAERANLPWKKVAATLNATCEGLSRPGYVDGFGLRDISSNAG